MLPEPIFYCYTSFLLETLIQIWISKISITLKYNCIRGWVYYFDLKYWNIEIVVWHNWIDSNTFKSIIYCPNVNNNNMNLFFFYKIWRRSRSTKKFLLQSLLKIRFRTTDRCKLNLMFLELPNCASAGILLYSQNDLIIYIDNLFPMTALTTSGLLFLSPFSSSFLFLYQKDIYL